MPNDSNAVSGTESDASLDGAGDDYKSGPMFGQDDMRRVQLSVAADKLAELPPEVRRRVNALKNLQLQVTSLEAKFYEEVHQLECKYTKLYYPIHEKRHTIVTGLYEPTDAESEWKLNVKPDSVAADLKKLKVDDKSAEDKKIVGIPSFWLKCFKEVGMIAEMIQPHDEEILEHLIDVKTILLENPMGFVLEFHFSPNDYFSNSVLTKEYEMKCEPDAEDPFSFEGPEIVKCKGSKINWKKGKNVTVRLVKKKQKQKKGAQVRTVTKTIPNDSFFNFFNPPDVPEDSESDNYDETQALLTTDFEIGHYIRERVIPNAVLYYTGEMIIDEDDEYDDEGEDEEDEGDDELEEEECSDEEEEVTRKRKSEKPGTKPAKTASPKTPKGAEEKPAECKQQ